jgi:hypothetical protein
MVNNFQSPFIDFWNGTMCVPSLGGKDCPSNGEHFTPEGKEIECCCDNCKAMCECFPWEYIQELMNPKDK